jgi:hypothetical protein
LSKQQQSAIQDLTTQSIIQAQQVGFVDPCVESSGRHIPHHAWQAHVRRLGVHVLEEPGEETDHEHSQTGSKEGATPCHSAHNRPIDTHRHVTCSPKTGLGAWRHVKCINRIRYMKVLWTEGIVCKDAPLVNNFGLLDRPPSSSNISI